jgi:hypothetical protein
MMSTIGVTIRFVICPTPIEASDGRNEAAVHMCSRYPVRYGALPSPAEHTLLLYGLDRRAPFARNTAAFDLQGADISKFWEGLF